MSLEQNQRQKQISRTCGPLARDDDTNFFFGVWLGRRAANGPGVCDLTARGCALAACLAGFPHRFHIVFLAFRRAGITELGANAANAVSKRGAACKQNHTSPAKFNTFATKPNTFPHCGWIVRQGLIARLRTPPQALQTLLDTSLDDLAGNRHVKLLVVGFHSIAPAALRFNRIC